METVLPVRPALVDRGSAARLKPGMLEELVGSGAALAMVLSGRQALVSGNSLVLLDAAETRRHLADTAVRSRTVIYLGSALAGSDLDAGTELVLFVLPQQFEVQAEEFEAHVAGIPSGCAVGGVPRRRGTPERHGHRAVHRSQRHRQLARHPHALPALRHPHAAGSRRLGPPLPGR